MERRSKTIAVVVTITVLVAATIGWAIYVTQAIGGMPLSGWLAMIFGIVFAVLIGVGLMTLVFYSSRRGHDEPPHWP